jgi:uncharacterized membrane protein HdeD (DUF308 family)
MIMLQTICGRWWVLLLRGLCAIALGVLMFVMPGITLLALVWMFAIFIIADGVASVVIGFRGEADGTVWWTMVFLGALAIVAGLVASGMALFHPGLTLVTLVIVIGISAIARGIVEIIAAIRLRKLIDDEWLLALSGLMSIMFGILINARPGAGVVAIGFLIGAFMMTLGILAVVLSFRLRKVGRKLAAAGT